ncbi:carbohydrate ABC transporter permease [Natrinema sp. 74]|uniref:carbohydrate ABC transporter permease n=1 Tax=Natrinema sp. 74 TaxID=3384159 RepID=UPI0038D443BB
MIDVVRDSVTRLRDRLATTDQRSRKSRFGILLFAPALVLLMSLFLIPIAYIFYLSLHDIGILEASGEFVGIGNYVELFTDAAFQHALWVGTVYAVGSVAFQLLLGLALALLANKSFRGVSVVRTLVIFPYLVPMIAVVIMWRWIANPVYGVLNYALTSTGLVSESINFFGSLELVMPALIVASSWKYTAFVSLILLARLQAIDETLYEQAKISGASTWQMFREVTLPNLKNAILLVVFLRSIFMFNKYSSIWLFTEGGPLSATTNLPIYLYERTFHQFELGMGSAAAMTLFGILICFAIVYFTLFNPSEEIETTS